ncbi:MAG: hypothetical protein IKQ35_02580 [Bacilli bacterium]|nr:hypothetical protein [Bacilli bacterium]
MDNKVLVKIYVPKFEREFEMYIYVGKKIGDVIVLFSRMLADLSKDYYQYENELLYNKNTGEKYDVLATIKKTNIRNGTELVFI